jgi:16S rRNA pseudouridine516 synthase
MVWMRHCAPMRLADILYSQGFGTRRACDALLQRGAVAVGGQVLDDPAAEVPTNGLVFTVNGQDWPYHARLLVLLNKPAGYECSREPQHHPSVLSLLPEPLRNRGVQPVGRLDQDTTGALLFTDHGPWLHRLTHPKRHVNKVYRVRTARDIEAAQVAALLQGVVLKDDPKPAQALACNTSGPRDLLLTISEGRYHQVKRMLAAVGNHVDALHRVSFGPWVLPDDMAAGQWRWVESSTLQD